MSCFIKKTIKISLVTVTTLTVTVLAVEIKSPAHAVDISGKQRMYTQRMLKDYAMIGMGNTFGNPKEDLRIITKDFQDNLKSLVKYAKSDETKKSLKKVETLWTPLQTVLLETPNKEKVEKLQVDLDTLLQAANDTTKHFAKNLGTDAGETVNKAGRQRMLSQRMASLYMLKVWDVKDPQFETKLKESMELFKTSQEALEISSINTDEINTLLAKVKRSFMFFEMMSKSKSKFIPTLIYKKSNDILENMNSVTEKYVAIETK